MPPRSPFARSLLLICAFTWGFSASFVAAPPPATGRAAGAAGGGPTRSAATSLAAVPRTSSVSLDATAVAVPTDGAFSYDATVVLARPAPFLQARLRIRRPSGRLLYQKTFVKSNVPAGPVVFTFARTIADLDLRPDVYPVELSVLSEGNPPNAWEVPEALRVYDPASKPLRVAVVVKVSSPPAIDPEGRFVTDPGLETVARDEVVALANSILRDARLRATIAIAPELLQEWKAISSGYTYAGTAGLEKVGANTTVPTAYGGALQQLGLAVATGRLELLDVPYADPDIAGLSSTRRESDLEDHYRLGAAAYAASVDETASSGTFTARGCLTLAAAREATAHGMHYALVSTRYVRGTEETAPAGAVTSPKIPLALLIPDAPLGAVLRSGTATSAVATMFERALKIADESSTALPVAIDVGPGRSNTVAGLVQRITPLLDQPWVTFVTAKTAAATARENGDVTLARSANPPRNTPPGWWSSTSASRRYADALASVLGPGDPDGTTAVSDSLIAQSATWAGPDGKWALADRGRAFSAAALRRAQGILDAVSVSARDLTLSGSSGTVPFSITNDSGRPLTVVLRLTTQKLTLGSQSLREQMLLPAENYVTVPVELRSAAEGRLRLQVVADTLVIASTLVTVRASYLDRLAIVGAVAVVLGVMLFYIRRRVNRAEDEEEADDGDVPPPAPSDDAGAASAAPAASAERG